MGSRMDARLSIAVVAAVFFAASAFPGISVGLEGYSPGHLALLRFLVASFGLAIYAVFSGMRPPAARDLPAVALAGFLAFSAYNVLLGYGQTSVPAGTASLLIASIPAFTAIWAVAFLEERLGVRGWAGIVVSFLGVTLISFGKGEGFGADPGALLVLLAALSASGYFAMQKPYLQRYGAFEFTSYAIWAGTLLLLPFSPGLLEQARKAHVGANTGRCLPGDLHSALLRHRRLCFLQITGLESSHLGVSDPTGGDPHRLSLARGGAFHPVPGRRGSGDSRRGIGQHAGREERVGTENRVSGTDGTWSTPFLLEVGDEKCGDLLGLLCSVFGHPQREGDGGSLVEDHKPLCQVLRIPGATLGSELSQVSSHPCLLLHHHHPSGMVGVW